MNDRLARVALSRLGEPGDPRLASLVEELGADRVHTSLVDPATSGMAAEVAERLRGLDPAADLERAAERGIRFVVPTDGEWPARLADLHHAAPVNGRGGAPLGLWLRGAGRLDELCERSVSVVGSRSATTYGVGVAGEIGASLATAGVTVVSGAAFGIDQAAHRGALAGGGPTVAVLACGVDRAYPAAHRDLLGYIAEQGLVVSELPPGCAPTRLRFLSRNRVIAGASVATVVVEAAVRSGALNTATWAASLNRTVMGVPGPVTSAPSEGVHDLIRSRGAVLVTRGADVLELVSPSGAFTQASPRTPVRPRDRLSETDQRVLEAVPISRPASATALARTAGVSVSTVHQSLQRLADGGWVARTSIGWLLGRDPPVVPVADDEDAVASGGDQRSG
ncbi:MAG: DNA-processing protein DprA [Nocardioidaceae bacterium]